MFKENFETEEIDIRKYLFLKGVRVHNLKNINLVLPKNKLIVITGVSGSGKSSLAFDTLYAEGQRRYIESLSSYSRQFLERMEKPDVDVIGGIAPAIAIQQKNSIRNPRSTVGTNTEIYDYLRLLFARIGKTFCTNCGRIVVKDNVKTIINRMIEIPKDSKVYILFPLEKTNGLILKEKLENLQKAGFFRLLINNEIIDLNENPTISSNYKDKYVLVDRLIINKEQIESDNRIADSIETALKNGNGELVIRIIGSEQNLFFSNKYECADCKISYEEPDLHLFSFNNPRGACKVCQGFGQFINFDMHLIVPDINKPLSKGAISIWDNMRFERYNDEMLYMCKKNNVRTDVPFKELNKNELKKIILGTGIFLGIKGFFDEIEKRIYLPEYSKIFFKYRGITPCPECEGSRLRQEVHNIYVDKKNIRDIINMDIDTTLSFFRQINLSEMDRGISFRILQEITKRLQYLSEVGLNYITLNRSSISLSGGESQRINLATLLGSSLVGSLYVLDEPSIGLHPRDNYKLIKILKSIRDLGNTIIVVEHDAEMMYSADYIVDMGPGAGEKGGEVIAKGVYDEICNDPKSITGKYLNNTLRIEVPKQRREPKEFLEIYGASENNLKISSVKIPLHSFVCITGVSGSGKSSLMIDVLYTALKRYEKLKSTAKSFSKNFKYEFGNVRSMVNYENISSVELIDQSPIGKSSRSNPVTYIKAFDIIREIFASTPSAKAKGFSATYFSFNQPEGSCDLCDGEGYQTVEMQFMADISLPCESCKGKRFKNEVLDVYFNGKNIHDVLNLTVTESLKFFETHKRLIRKLKILESVGLGYLKLGQSSSTFSGGEAQRLKLATNLEIDTEHKNKLYIFDEPTTGLHFDDIAKLLKCFDALIEAGNSIIIIEHNMDVIKCADYIIDLGPEGGENGGRVVAFGKPEEIIKFEISRTGKILKKYL